MNVEEERASQRDVRLARARVPRGGAAQDERGWLRGEDRPGAPALRRRRSRRSPAPSGAERALARGASRACAAICSSWCAATARSAAGIEALVRGGARAADRARHAHARRRRQRPRQHPGPLQRPGDDGAGRGARWTASWRRSAQLGGVCSGEHGIGVTKLKYLEPELRGRARGLPARGRPRGDDEPRQARRTSPPSSWVFTPSFNLLELEARILRHGKLEELALKIANCVRCGKCKPDCCVFYPARGMFFHPRNKNLAIGVAHRGAALRRAARSARRASSCCATSRRWPTTAPSATSA